MNSEYQKTEGSTLSNKEKINSFFAVCLSSTFNTYSKNLLLCKENFSEEAVHDFRVSVRRLNSLLKLISEVYRINYVLKLRKIFKSQLSLFGKLRDTQVQILNLKRLEKFNSILESYLTVLSLKEELYIMEIKESLKNIEYENIQAQIDKLSQDISEYNSLTDLSIEILRILRHSFEDVLRVKNKVVADSTDSIHKLRLVFKKFRYMMEHIQPLTDISSKKLADFRMYQTMMGNIQDNVVLASNLENYLSIDTGLHSNELAELMYEIRQDGSKLINSFIAKIDMVYSFWDFSFK